MLRSNSNAAAQAGPARLRLADIKFANWFALICTLVLVVPYTTGAISYLFEQGTINLQPRNYLIGTAAAVCFHALLRPPRISLPILFLLSLLLLRALDALFWDRVPSTSEFSPQSIAAAAFVFSVSILCLSGSTISLRLAGLACSTLTIGWCFGMNFWEWQNPGFFSTTMGRSAGMLQNANSSALVIATMLGLALSLTPSVWLAVANIVMALLGIYFSLSRSGMVVGGMVILVYLLVRVRQNFRTLIYFGVLLLLAALVASRVVDFYGAVAGQKDVEARQSLFAGKSELDVNDTGRMDLLMEGLESIRAEPFIGHGTCSAYGSVCRPHNELVAAWVDTGILGALLYLVAVIALVRQCWLRDRTLLVGCVPLVTAIPFSHNLLEDKSYLFCWLICAGLVQHARSTSKDAKRASQVSSTRVPMPAAAARV